MPRAGRYKHVARRWYHGAERRRTSWDLATIGQGNDEYGPGWYLTTREETAAGYAKAPDGLVHVVQWQPGTKLLRREHRIRAQGLWHNYVTRLIKMAHDSENTVANFGEDPAQALRAAVAAVLQRQFMHEVLLQIWIDFYRYSSAAWAENVLTVTGISGALIDRPNSYEPHEEWAVIWNPGALEILQAYPPKEPA